MSCASLKEFNFQSNKIMPLSYDKMNSMRKHQILCDIIVRIGSKILHVHKIVLASNSDYFEKMFTGSFIESNAEEITLSEIDSNAVELLIDYMYTSKLKITERNVQSILLASNFLLIEDVDSECIKFMKESIHVENCWAYKHFADTNNVVELDDFCFSFILDHFTVLSKSGGFLLQPVELITELLQSNQLNVTEEKIYEFIILWVKHEMKNRIEFLPGLMEFVNMSLIPVNYFMNHIENEEILKSHCNCVLYDALKMYTNNFYSGCRMPFNQLILISSWKKNRNNLEWMMTGNKIIKATKFSWTTFNSIILRDGRIFRLSYCSDDNNWYGRIYSEDHWNFVGNFRFKNGFREMLRLIELSECIYVMSHLGYFKCFDIKKNTWEDLEGIIIPGDNLRGLTVCDGILYSINSLSVSRFNADTKRWIMISKNRPLLRIDYSMVCSLNGCLYEIGGMSRQDGAYLKTAMKFDLSSNTWNYIACMKYARKNAGVVAVNGLIYVFGGENCSTFEMYDPRENKWTLSDCKLSSNNHVITRAFILDPELNISPENFSKYYPEY